MNYEKVLSFIRDCRVCYLATCSGNQPNVRPMSFFLKEDDRLWMATYKDSRKVDEIKENDKVEICFVDEEYQHLRVRATGEILTDRDCREELWEMSENLDNYFEGVDDPNFAILDLEISSVEVMMKDSMEYTEVEPT